MHEAKSLITEFIESLTGFSIPDYFAILILIMASTLIVMILMKKRLSPDKPGIIQHIMELWIETVGGFMKDIIGPHADRYLPIIGAFSILILFSNLIGLIPGFMPPTGNIIVTISLALTSFFAYNFYGFKAHGIGYLKHFAGPIAWLMFLFIPIEIVSNLARPLSLSVRLFGNIFGDHQVGNVFLHLCPPVIPVPLILLGIFVSFLQTLVFMILSIIYIAGAVEHH